MTNTMEKKTFENKLRAYKRNSKASQLLAHELAVASIQLFAEHGQLAYANAFLTTMLNNYSRKPAYVAWMRKFSPCAIRTNEKTKAQEFYKVKGDAAVPFNVAEAEKVKFWDLTPEPTVTEITETAIIRRLDIYRRQLLKAQADKEAGKTGLISEKAVDLVPQVDAMVKALAQAAHVALKPDEKPEEEADTDQPAEKPVVEPVIDLSDDEGNDEAVTDLVPAAHVA